jgi:hypothetical protein
MVKEAEAKIWGVRSIRDRIAPTKSVPAEGVETRIKPPAELVEWVRENRHLMPRYYRLIQPT